MFGDSVQLVILMNLNGTASEGGNMIEIKDKEVKITDYQIFSVHAELSAS